MNPRVESEVKSFSSDGIQQRLYSWWSGLEERKGGRARLRRCRKPSDVLVRKEFFRFYEIIGEPKHLDREKLAAVCGLLSHVEEDAGRKDLGELLGQAGPEASRPKVTEPRFRRLLYHENQSDLYRPMIRILSQIDNRVPIHGFEKTVFYWDSEGTRESLAFDYYKTIPLD
ncbi:MAG: type I-E CRISPR-associated protein Cse2/CasB [Candidatus Acetothermia bacterium]